MAAKDYAGITITMPPRGPLRESLQASQRDLQAALENMFEPYRGVVDIWKRLVDLHHISKEEALPILRRYRWFVSPSIPPHLVSQIVSKTAHTKGKGCVLSSIFLDHFSQNNWMEMEVMVERWARLPLARKRMRIFRGALRTLQLVGARPSFNTCLVVLSTLISQIDGIMSDYLRSHNLEWGASYDDQIDKKKKTVRKVGRKSLLKKEAGRALRAEYRAALDVLLDVLLQPWKPRITSAACESNLSRHRIMHVEYVNYGRKDYLVRTFMLAIASPAHAHFAS